VRCVAVESCSCGGRLNEGVVVLIPVVVLVLLVVEGYIRGGYGEEDVGEI
jgi:hypothetical protein